MNDDSCVFFPGSRLVSALVSLHSLHVLIVFHTTWIISFHFCWSTSPSIIYPAPWSSFSARPASKIPSTSSPAFFYYCNLSFFISVIRILSCFFSPSFCIFPPLLPWYSDLAHQIGFHWLFCMFLFSFSQVCWYSF